MATREGVCASRTGLHHGAELQSPKSLRRSAKQHGNRSGGGREWEHVGSLLETGRSKGPACHQASGNRSKAIMSRLTLANTCQGPSTYGASPPHSCTEAVIQRSWSLGASKVHLGPVNGFRAAPGGHAEAHASPLSGPGRVWSWRQDLPKSHMGGTALNSRLAPGHLMLGRCSR